MFEPVKIKEWKCKKPWKIVKTKFFTKDKMGMHEAKFSLDEIINIKELKSELETGILSSLNHLKRKVLCLNLL